MKIKKADLIELALITRNILLCRLLNGLFGVLWGRMVGPYPTTQNTQSLLLALQSGLTPGRTCGAICAAMDQAWIDCEQSKLPACCATSLAQQKCLGLWEMHVVGCMVGREAVEKVVAVEPWQTCQEI